TPAARLGVSAIGLSVKNAGWPARGPAQIELAARLAGGGTLTVAGNGELDHRVVRVKVRARNADVAQAQPYLPFRGRVRGRLEAELDVRGRLDPLAVQVRGNLGVSDAELVDGDRQLLTVGRIDATGIDYRAPAQISVDDVRVVKPWALVDRDERGQLSLVAALTARPRVTAAPEPPPAARRRLRPEVAVRHALVEDGGTNIVNELGIGDANRQLLTADHARAEGVDVQWPGGVRVTRMEIAKPWVLFERETSGRFPLVDLLTPRARAAPKPRTSRDPGPREPTEPLRFSLGTLALTDGFGRFVDHATDPDFAEELSAV